MTIYPQPKVIRPPKKRKRLPRASKRIARTTPVRKRSARRGQVEAADAKWRADAKAKAPNECQFCGAYLMENSGEVHHVYPKKSHPRLRFYADNAIHLHVQCHRLAHGNMKAFRRWFARTFPEVWPRLHRKAQRETRLRA